MSFSFKNPINSQSYYRKKYNKIKKTKIGNVPISIKDSQMSNIIGFDNKIKGNIISLSYFNSKLKNNKGKNNFNEQSKSEIQKNHSSFLLENKKQNNHSINKNKQITYNKSYNLSKSNQNSLIINLNNDNSKFKKETKSNLLREVLQKYSNISYKSRVKNNVSNKKIINHAKNNSLKNNKVDNLLQKRQKRNLSTINLFNNKSYTSNINKRRKNSVIKIEQNNCLGNNFLKYNSTYINKDITGKKENNKKTFANRIKAKTRNKNEKIKLIILSRNNRSFNNIKTLNLSKLKNRELDNKTSFMNKSNSEIREFKSKTIRLKIYDTTLKNNYLITPKNIRKDSNLVSKEKKKNVKKYYQYYKKKEVLKKKPILILNTNLYINGDNVSKENINNNILIQKNNTSINLKNKSIRKVKHSINIIDIFRIKKPNQKIIKAKKINSCINNIPKNTNVNINKSINYSKAALNTKQNNTRELKNNKIQNILFKENNLYNICSDDNFDNLYSVIRKIKFNSNKSDNIFTINSQIYKNYSKQFNSLFNNFYSKQITNAMKKYHGKSNAKIFTESTGMKTDSYSKNKCLHNIDNNHQIREFKLD